MYLIYLLSWSFFILVLASSNDLREMKESRTKRIEILINDYVQHNNAEALRQESVKSPEAFCQRKYVSGQSLGCGNFGNSNFKYLSGILHAIILNRTFVSPSKIHCPETLHHREWIPFIPEVASLRKKINCNGSGITEGSLMEGYVLPDFHGNYTVGDVFRYDYFCFMNRVDANILSFYNGELNPFTLFNRCNGNLTLDVDPANRVHILHSHPIHWISHFESMGYAFHTLLYFNETVRDYVKDILNEVFPGQQDEQTPKFPKDTVTIAMHIRHRHSNSRAKDVEFVAQLNQTLSILYPGQKCRLLLATDREATLADVTQHAIKLGCQVYTAPKPIQPKENCTVLNACEQGPWKVGVVQMADLYLLSHAQHFIGDPDSTFSHTIAYLVSYNRAISELGGYVHNQSTVFLDFVGGGNMCCLNGRPCTKVCPYDVAEKMRLVRFP